MEAPEVPLEAIQEHIAHHAEHEGGEKKWVLGVALSSAIFAALAAFHVVLPPQVDQPRIVATLMLVLAAVSAIVRFRRGELEVGVKTWWESKTIWTAIVGAGVAVLALFGLPALDQGSAVATVMFLVSLYNAWLHPGPQAALR